MFNRLGEKIIKFRWAVICFWIIAAGVIYFTAPVLSNVAKGDQASFLPDNSETSKAAALYKRLYPDKGEGSPMVMVLHRNTSLDNKDKTYALEFEKFLNENLSHYNIREIRSPFSQKKFEATMISRDNKTAYIVIGLNTPGYKEVTNETVRTIKALTKGRASEIKGIPALPEGLDVRITGEAAFGQETTDNISDSMNLTARITIILVLVVLVFIYRSPVAPIVPLFTIVLSFVISRGAVAGLTNYGLRVSSFTETFMMAVLFGAGTDYCLLLASRFREELLKNSDEREALKKALPSSWIAIISSGATVIVGFLAMILAKFGLYSTTGPSIAIGVGITILAVITLTPAILAVLGEKAFWPKHPTKNIEKEYEADRFWRKLSDIVIKRPSRLIIVCLVIFIPFMISSLGIGRSFDQLANLPVKSEARQGFDLIKQSFDQGEMLPVKVILSSNTDMWSNDALQTVEDMSRNILKIVGVARIRTATRPLGEPLDAVSLTNQLDAMSGGLEKLNNGTKNIGSGLKSGSDSITKLNNGTEELINGIEELNTKLKASGNRYDKLSSSTVEFIGKFDQLKEGISKAKAASENIVGFLDTAVNLLAKNEKIKLEFLKDVSLQNSYKAILGAAQYAKGVNEGLKQIEGSLEESRGIIESAGSGLEASKKELTKLNSALSAVKNGLEQIRSGQNKLGSGLLTASQKLDEISNGLNMVQSGSLDYKGNQNFNRIFYLPQGVLEKNPQLREGMEYYISKDGKGMELDVILSIPPYSKQAMDIKDKIKNVIDFTIKGTKLENSVFYITGSSAVFSELRGITAEDFTKVMFFVLAGIFIVLVLLLRSIITPIYLILTIILSYTATMGITYLTFQILFGEDGLNWSVPFFSFCILVALGVDYNIFLMSRVKEEYIPGDVTGGIGRALSSTGKIITSCGIIMAGTFGALMASPIVQLVQIGFTAVIGLLLDTFIIRSLLVPAIAVKFGELNWWPGKRVKIIPADDIKG